MRIFFQKLIALAALPFLFGIASLIFWQLYKCIAKKPENVIGKGISTFIILMFLAHPNIVQYMLYDMKCVDIDGEQRMKADLEILCWTKTHYIYTFALAVPSLLVWGIGLPFFGFMLLTKVRN